MNDTRGAARTFVVIRDVDVTGISGTGIVAEGVEFSDGTVALRWLDIDHEHPNYVRGVRPTTVLHESIASVEALHGHGGATRIVWDDPYIHAIEFTTFRPKINPDDLKEN